MGDGHVECCCHLALMEGVSYILHSVQHTAPS